MNTSSGDQRWPALAKDDDELLEELLKLLTARVADVDPYSSDGTFAASIEDLPPGLRAMAATHWLDISLTLDSITWHFGNFGDAQLVAETEAGLRELGLDDLTQCFSAAKELMLPLLESHREPADDTDQILERAGLAARARELEHRPWDLHGSMPAETQRFARHGFGWRAVTRNGSLLKRVGAPPPCDRLFAAEWNRYGQCNLLAIRL